MADLATAYVQIVPSARGMKEGLSNIFGNEMPSAGQSAGGIFGSNLIGTLKKAIAAAGIGEALKQTLTEGAALEQSLGGIETLFKDGAATVIANAEQAYKTAGMSANSYMEQVTSFSASLLQSLSGDTAKAAEIADMAMTDMSDNANKMGTDMEAIANAYQGFAKQNYTMLDNLKLGYGGTKTEMQSLLKDAQALTGVKYDISNLSDVYEAIHVIQKELKISGLSAEEAAEMVAAGLMTEQEAFEALGTTAKEASTTLTGSFNAMKAAASDVLGNLALGRDLTPSLNALVETTVTFLTGNLIPAVKNIVTALPGALVTLVKALVPGGMKELATTVVTKLSAFLQGAFPSLLTDGTSMITQLATGFISGIPGFLQQANYLLNMLASALFSAAPVLLSNGVDLISQLAVGFLEGIPAFLEQAGSLIQSLLSALLSAAPSLLSSGATLVLNLASGLIASLPSIISSGTTIIAQLLSTFAEHLPDLLAQGISLIGQLVAGLISMIPDVVSSAGDIAQKIWDTICETDWLGLGKAIIDGIVRGISNAASSLFNALKDLASQALQAAKDALDIHSPSRRFDREVGYQIPAGEAQGIRRGFPLVRNALKFLNDITTSAFVSELRIRARVQTSGVDSTDVAAKGRSVTVNQYIYSEAKTAADLMREARYQAEKAVLLGV